VAGHEWFTPGILATQEAEIRRIAVRSQPRQILHKILSLKNALQMTGGVAQGVGPEFKLQYHNKRIQRCLSGIETRDAARPEERPGSKQKLESF
jgi:hypothetical protein